MVRVLPASNAGVNTLGPQREKSCRDFPLRFACLGQRPQTPLERRISFCGCAFCERFGP